MSVIEINCVGIYYKKKLRRPAIVFIHDATLNHRIWRLIVSALNEDYRTVVYDYRSHDQSGVIGRTK